MSSNARVEELLSKVLNWVNKTDASLMDIQVDIFGIRQKVESHATSIKQLEQQFNQFCFFKLMLERETSEQNYPESKDLRVVR